jgi:succinoglycan biosynthesis protein ExoA
MSYRVRDTSDDSNNLNRPFVSVIMPVRNEEDHIARSLGSLLDQTYPHSRMEIVVADGMSVDTTRSVVTSIAKNSAIAVKIVDNEKMTAAAGLNCALARSGGEIIIRIDGHCEVDPDYVSSCVDLLVSRRAEGVGGPIETIGETERARSIATAMSSSFGVGGSAFRTVDDREMYTDTVAFPGYTRKVIERVGPFNEELVRDQDDEYNFRIRKDGGRILLSPKIRSRYYSRGTFRSLWRQYYQYGYWKVRLLQMHPRQMSLRHFVPAVFVSSLLFLAAGSTISNVLRVAFACTILAYATANFLSAFQVAKESPKSIPAVMWSVIILHTSYGCGFLVGLARFWRKWNKGPSTCEPQTISSFGAASYSQEDETSMPVQVNEH